jgi:hypothetical protein
MHSTRVALTASTTEQTVLEKQWNRHVVVRAFKLETSETTPASVIVRGSVGDSEFLHDTPATTLELLAWVPVNTSPPTLRSKFRIEADETAGGTPDVAVTILYEYVQSPINNLPWIHGNTVSAASADSLAAKQFDRNAMLTWLYLSFTGGTFQLKVGDSPVNGDDLGAGITEPRTTDEGIEYPYPIPSNVDLVGTTVSATGSFLVKVDKPW